MLPLFLDCCVCCGGGQWGLRVANNVWQTEKSCFTPWGSILVLRDDSIHSSGSSIFESRRVAKETAEWDHKPACDVSITNNTEKDSLVLRQFSLKQQSPAVPVGHPEDSKAPWKILEHFRAPWSILKHSTALCYVIPIGIPTVNTNIYKIACKCIYRSIFNKLFILPYDAVF